MGRKSKTSTEEESSDPVIYEQKEMGLAAAQSKMTFCSSYFTISITTKYHHTACSI